MKIYVKDIMPEDPIFWAEVGMPLHDVARIMVERSFTLLPVRDAAKNLVGTVSQRSLLRYFETVIPPRLHCFLRLIWRRRS